MEKIIVFFLALLIPLGMAATARAAQGTPATPTSVVFFYNLAMVAVESKQAPVSLPGGGKGFVLALPSKADMSSLNVSINGEPAGSVIWPHDPELAGNRTPFLSTEDLQAVLMFEIGDMDWGKGNSPVQLPYLTLRPEEEKDPARKTLLEAYGSLKDEAALIAGRIKAAEASIALWQKGFTDGSAAQPEDFAKMETMVREHLPALQAALQKDNATLLDSGRKLKDALLAIQKYDAAHRVRLVHVLPAKETTGQTAISYTYTLEATSYPSYQVNAMPDKGELRLEQSAHMALDAAVDWKDVEVSLAFLNQGKGLVPRLPYPWILDYGSDKTAKYSMRSQAPAYSPAPVQAEMTMAVADGAGGSDNLVAKQRARSAVQEEMSTFRLWKLGKRDISADEPLQAVLASTLHKADFFYTVRPTIDRNGFLTANIDFAEPAEMPRGSAVCSIDGMYAGTQYLSLNGKKGTIYLGPDPQVTVQVNDLEKKRGSQGFISTEQTQVWHWEMTVANARSRDIIVRVEEPEPVSRDKTIKVSVNSSPKAESVIPEDENADSALKLLVWKKTLKPKETFVIKHKVEVAATSGKSLDSNR